MNEMVVTSSIFQWINRWFCFSPEVTYDEFLAQENRRQRRNALDPVDPQTEALGVLDLRGETVSYRLTGSFDYIHLFEKDREHLDTTFPKLKGHLNTDGMLWVSWPKRRRLGTDLTLKNVIEIGYSQGLVESKTISVDSTWSAIKFTFPKEGKQYNNSYGQLKKRSS